MEMGLDPTATASSGVMASAGIDQRGGVTVIVALVALGLWSLRPPPTPSEPVRVAPAASEAWMADALPGVGVKTRVLTWRHLQQGQLNGVPERARKTATQVFVWSTAGHQH